MYLLGSDRSRTGETYVPAEVPTGNPGSVPGVTATPTVPVPGANVQQWMWATVVVPDNPVQSASMRSWFASPSKTTVTNPDPVAPGASGESGETNVMGDASAAGASKTVVSTATAAARTL